ncbi:hypothetical protein C9374_000706 [Naegleria lovaniensis]|uniref:Fe2OG dioxygenase domain-containing protein n=1 Tax=Naegleria lovaniensis TaxID=51637 RepID=A0AA88KTA7_NAELO|nr:uncharacterized protein C9374_000706 [Naegleria lovaniensis]KAG2388542.1 hypothetical protein C9374_000706 [Naegleria lovaniensis]
MIPSVLLNIWNSLPSFSHHHHHHHDTSETSSKTITTTTTQKADSEPTSKITSSSSSNGTDKTYHINDLLIPFPSIPVHEILQIDREHDIQSSIQFESLEHAVTGCFLLHNVLTRLECETLIQISEQMGYQPSPLSILSGQFNTSEYNQSTKQVRDSERVLTDMPQEVIRVLNERIEKYLPQTIQLHSGEWTFLSKNGKQEEIIEKERNNEYSDLWLLRKGTPINERIRFNKYTPTKKFGPHFDAGYKKNKNEMTLLTIIFYLNDNFSGGETTFFPGGKRTQMDEPNSVVKEYRIVPRAGMVSVFYQNGPLNHRHEGSPVIEGCKYIIRSDIAYVRAVPLP